MRKEKFFHIILVILILGFLYHTHFHSDQPFYILVPLLLTLVFIYCIFFQRKKINIYHKNVKEIESLQQRLSEIINSMPSLLICVDSDYRITLCNNKAHTECPHSAKEALGKSLVTFFPQLKSELVHIRSCIEGGNPIFLKKRRLEINGVNSYKDITIFPLGDDGAGINITDQTELYRMEELMVQGEKMVSIGQLASGMAHEINNPLAAIIQAGEVIYDRLNNETLPANIRAAEKRNLSLHSLSEYMEERGILSLLGGLRESGQRVSEIVNSMFSFVRKEGTQVSTHKLSTLVKNTLTLTDIASQLEGQDFHSVNIKLDLEEDSSILCNKDEIEQVIFNVLKNSAEALRESCGSDELKTIHVRLKQNHQENMAQIEIEDSGVGMTEETMRRVFDPFYTTKPIGKGMGLGLSVSYFIITENHKGTIIPKSQLGKGTVFTIELPLDKKSPVKGEN